MNALRFNSGKPQWSLLPRWTLLPMIRVLEFGAAKYAPDNWKKGLNREEILESIQRHLDSLFDGDEEDHETKLHHVGHIMCNCIFYFYHFTKQSFSPRINEYGAAFKKDNGTLEELVSKGKEVLKVNNIIN